VDASGNTIQIEQLAGTISLSGSGNRIACLPIGRTAHERGDRRSWLSR